MADVVKVTTTRSIYQSGWIIAHCPLYNFLCFELAPGFIEGNPYHDGREIEVCIHNGLPFFAEHFLRPGRALFLRSLPDHARSRFPSVAKIPAGHILPYQHAKAVTMVVPAR